MEAYKHKVQYYETDQMAIVHHSNYVRWMEEARVDYLEQLGCPLDSLEREGVVSPVVSLECRYRSPARFPETVTVTVKVTEFRGVRLRLGYELRGADGRLCAEGKSEHCFTGPDGRPVNMKRSFPEVWEKLAAQVEE